MNSSELEIIRLYAEAQARIQTLAAENKVLREMLLEVQGKYEAAIRGQINEFKNNHDKRR